MAGIVLAGVHSAGGVQLGGGNSTFLINGSPVVVNGDPVAPHGNAPHNAPRMIAASGWCTWNGVAVVIAGDLATCGHASNGQSNWDFE